jgi:hypothetical protein
MAHPKTGNSIPLLKKISEVCLAHAKALETTRMPYRQLEATFKNIKNMVTELVLMYEEGSMMEQKAELERLAAEKERMIQDAVDKAK